VSLSFLLCSFVLGPLADMDGRWRLKLERQGWHPATDQASLVLTRTGKEWQGSLRFGVILYAREHPLQDITVSNDRVEFRLHTEEFDLRFDGTLKDATLEGNVAWKDLGKFPWTAIRDDGKPPQRFESKLSFAGFFPKGRAEDLGLDGAALDSLLRDAFENDTDALLIVKDGRVVCEQYFGGPRTAIHLMSVTKLVTALALPFLVEDGSLDLESIDEPVSTWFPDWDQGLKAKVTLRHLLQHASGLEKRPSALELNRQDDRLEFARGRAVEAEPGTRHFYSNEGIMLVGGIFEAAAGVPLDEYLKKKLFEPLDIKDWEWNRDLANHTVAYAELAMTPRDLTRIGWLLVDEERAGKRQRVAPEWIERLSTPSSIEKGRGLILDVYYQEGEDESVGFGHTGWLGQYLAVYPRWKLVGVRMRRFKNEAETGNAAFELGSFVQRLAHLVK